MNVQIVKFGKAKYKELLDYADVFVQRLNTHIKLSVDLRKGSSDEEREVEKFLRDLQPTDYVVVWDDCGDLLNSFEFSKELGKLRDIGTWKRLIFVIGSPFGVSEKIFKRANRCLSLSKMTLTSDLAFAIILEQLYRAFQIMAGTEYHHGVKTNRELPSLQ